MAVAERVSPLAAAGLGVTYSECLDWAAWLGIFTVSELADAMAVSRDVAQRGIVAMRFHGSIEDTGDAVSGAHGRESLFEYRVFQEPPDPAEHPTEPPEWVTCEKEILSPRGETVRLVDKNQDRRGRSMPGQAHRMRMREKRYKEMMERREQAYERHLARAQKAPKWKRKK